MHAVLFRLPKKKKYPLAKNIISNLALSYSQVICICWLCWLRCCVMDQTGDNHKAKHLNVNKKGSNDIPWFLFCRRTPCRKCPFLKLTRALLKIWLQLELGRRDYFLDTLLPFGPVLACNWRPAERSGLSRRAPQFAPLSAPLHGWLPQFAPLSAPVCAAERPTLRRRPLTVSPRFRTCRTRWTPPRSRTSSACTRCASATGTSRRRARRAATASTKASTGSPTSWRTRSSAPCLARPPPPPPPSPSHPPPRRRRRRRAAGSAAGPQYGRPACRAFVLL